MVVPKPLGSAKFTNSTFKPSKTLAPIVTYLNKHSISRYVPKMRSSIRYVISMSVIRRLFCAKPPPTQRRQNLPSSLGKWSWGKLRGAAQCSRVQPTHEVPAGLLNTLYTERYNMPLDMSRIYLGI